MDSGDRRSRVIPGELAEEVQAWETPDFDQPEVEARRRAEEEQARRIAREKQRRRRERRRQAVAERLRLEDEARRRLPSPEEIEEIRAQARRDGHREGYEEGRHEGFHAGYPEGLRAGQSDGRRAGALLVRRLRALLDTLGRPLEQLDRDAEDELLHMVFAVARRLALEELKADPEHALTAVRQAVAELPSHHRRVTIHVHPEEQAFIAEHIGSEAEQQGWAIVADRHLTPGGCVVTTETSRVDASVERRLDAVAEQLLGEAQAGEDGEAATRTYRGSAPSAEDIGEDAEAELGAADGEAEGADAAAQASTGDEAGEDRTEGGSGASAEGPDER